MNIKKFILEITEPYIRTTQHHADGVRDKVQLCESCTIFLSSHPEYILYHHVLLPFSISALKDLTQESIFTHRWN